MARKKGVEFLGFRFNCRWYRPNDEAIEKFRDVIRYRTRRQQPMNVSIVIKSINPLIVGWGRYFGIGTVTKLYDTLDSWLRARIRCFKAKKRQKSVILYTLPSDTLQEMGLVSLTSLITR